MCGGVAIVVGVAVGLLGETYDQRRVRRVIVSECECDGDEEGREGKGRE